ncbi:hypothetical protein [Streptomyces sp. NPDC050263]|uniref:hypothetical protein n=1 Tax=Streptomyces sp. NPDC050263 TaxID=3155037 RepID=UPI00341A0749
MAFPEGASTITLLGTFPVPVGGTARTGRIVLTPSAVLVDSRTAGAPRHKEPRMPDTPPTAFDRDTALRIAQQLAFENAHAAQEHHDQAAQHRTAAAEMVPAWGEDHDRELASAQEHRGLADRARAMADTWAHVATALTAGLDARPAAYDLNIQLAPENPDPKAVGEELARQMRSGRRRDGG